MPGIQKKTSCESTKITSREYCFLSVILTALQNDVLSPLLGAARHGLDLLISREALYINHIWWRRRRHPPPPLPRGGRSAAAGMGK